MTNQNLQQERNANLWWWMKYVNFIESLVTCVPDPGSESETAPVVGWSHLSFATSTPGWMLCSTLNQGVYVKCIAKKYKSYHLSILNSIFFSAELLTAFILHSASISVSSMSELSDESLLFDNNFWMFFMNFKTFQRRLCILSPCVVYYQSLKRK